MIAIWRMVKTLFWQSIIFICFVGLLFVTSALLALEKMEEIGVFKIIVLPKK